MDDPILVVEDSVHDLDFTLLALEKCAITNPVVVVRDGEEALDYLLLRGRYERRVKGNPALVLLDLKMPKVDGLDVLKTMRTTPSLVSVPVILLTHSTLDSDINRARLLGVDCYIVKSIDTRQFIADVHREVSAFTNRSLAYQA